MASLFCSTATALSLPPSAAHALATARSSFRGTLFAVRAILFPELRASGVESRGSGGADELPCDGVCGRARDWWLAVADDAGLPALYTRHPTPVRYAFAGLFGAILLGIMSAIQWAAAAYARWCMRVAFRVTGDARHLDEADYAAVAAGVEGKKRQ